MTAPPREDFEPGLEPETEEPEEEGAAVEVERRGSYYDVLIGGNVHATLHGRDALDEYLEGLS